MDEVIKKRTVIDRIKRAYISHCRGAGVDGQAGADIYLHADDIPKGAGINFEELGKILLSIEEDPKYIGLIKLEAVDAEAGRDCYRIAVSQDLIPRGIALDKRPKIMLARGWWIVSMPKKKDVRIAKQGTLAGELLGVLGMAWGASRKAEVVYDMLQKSVTHKATEGRPTGQQITDAMKEINRPLKKNGLRGIKLIKTADSLGGTWKFMLDALLPEAKVVSPSSSKNTRETKRPRKTRA